MDNWWLLCLAAACVCGSYKSKTNQPPTFRNNFANVENQYKPTTKVAWPYYVEQYPKISSDSRLSRERSNLGEETGMFSNYKLLIYKYFV